MAESGNVFFNGIVVGSMVCEFTLVLMQVVALCLQNG
jgi:hypothetical protein